MDGWFGPTEGFHHICVDTCFLGRPSWEFKQNCEVKVGLDMRDCSLLQVEPPTQSYRKARHSKWRGFCSGSEPGPASLWRLVEAGADSVRRLTEPGRTH